MHIVIGAWYCGLLACSKVRSECLKGTFRASCCSARLSRAQVPAFPVSSVRYRNNKGGGGIMGGGGGEDRLHESTSSPPKLVEGGGC